jgi:hypothetical protein
MAILQYAMRLGLSSRPTALAGAEAGPLLKFISEDYAALRKPLANLVDEHRRIEGLHDIIRLAVIENAYLHPGGQFPPDLKISLCLSKAV